MIYLFHIWTSRNSLCLIKEESDIHFFFPLCVCSWGIISVWWHALRLRKPALRRPLLIRSHAAFPPASNVEFFHSSTRSNRRDQSLSCPSDLTHKHSYSLSRSACLQIAECPVHSCHINGWRRGGAHGWKQMLERRNEPMQRNPLFSLTSTHT